MTWRPSGIRLYYICTYSLLFFIHRRCRRGRMARAVALPPHTFLNETGFCFHSSHYLFSLFYMTSILLQPPFRFLTPYSLFCYYLYTWILFSLLFKHSRDMLRHCMLAGSFYLCISCVCLTAFLFFYTLPRLP